MIEGYKLAINSVIVFYRKDCLFKVIQGHVNFISYSTGNISETIQARDIMKRLLNDAILSMTLNSLEGYLSYMKTFEIP